MIKFKTVENNINTLNKQVKRFAISTFIGLGFALTGMAGHAVAGKQAQLWETEVTSPPLGYVQFCTQFPSDCHRTDKVNVVEKLSKTRWEELITVNQIVNKRINPVTDADQYGVPEFWTYPTSAGDCEDFVLLKRKVLIERGWNESALLITVVRNKQGEGHAVLLVRTDKGEMVLDNVEQDVLPFEKTGYKYLKRQSMFNPTQWVRLQSNTAEG